MDRVKFNLIVRLVVQGYLDQNVLAMTVMAAIVTYGRVKFVRVRQIQFILKSFISSSRAPPRSDHYIHTYAQTTAHNVEIYTHISCADLYQASAHPSRRHLQ